MQRAPRSKLADLFPYYYGWNIVALAMLTSFFSIGVIFYTHGVFRLYLVRDFGFTEGDTFDVYSYYIGAIAFYSFFVTPRLIERLGSKRVMMTGAVVLSAALVALSRAPDKPVFFAVFALLVSLGVTLMGSIASQTALNYWFEARRGQALSIAATGVTAGGIVNIPLAGYLLEHYSWRTAYEVFALVVLLAGIPPIFFFWRDRPQDLGLAGEPGAPAAAPATTGEDEPLYSDRELLSHGVFLRLALSLGLASTGWSISLQSLISDLREQGYSAGLATFYMTALTWVILVGKPLYGAVSDRMDRKWAIALAVTLQLVAVGLFLLSRFLHPGAFSWHGVRGDGALVLAILLYGMGVGGCQPLYTAYQADLLGRRSFARAAGIMVPIITTWQFFGYKLNGYVLDKSPTHVWMWLLMGGFYVGSLVLLSFIPRAGRLRRHGPYPVLMGDTAPGSIVEAYAEAGTTQARKQERERDA